MSKSVKSYQGENPYVEAGHEDRFAYLQWLATEYTTQVFEVARLADKLGPEADFDELPKLLDDLYGGEESLQQYIH